MDSDSGSSHIVAAHSEAPSGFVIEGQIVLILCGLIASGKSTFAAALQQHFPQFRRCNQDDLGDRRRVENLARATLSDGDSVCIDRTNFNPVQRVDIAQEFPGTKIWVIVFDTPYDECAARLRTRQNHPTITNVEQGLIVLSRFAADFEYPSLHEGYHKILLVKPEDTRLNYTRPDIAAILQRVRDSPPINLFGIPRAAQQRVHRGNVNRGYRGRRRGYGHPHGQGQGLNTASQYVVHRSNTSRGGRGNTWGAVRSRGVSISENPGTSSEIGGSASRLDPFGVN